MLGIVCAFLESARPRRVSARMQLALFCPAGRCSANGSLACAREGRRGGLVPRVMLVQTASPKAPPTCLLWRRTRSVVSEKCASRRGATFPWGPKPSRCSPKRAKRPRAIAAAFGPFARGPTPTLASSFVRRSESTSIKVIDGCAAPPNPSITSHASMERSELSFVYGIVGYRGGCIYKGKMSSQPDILPLKE